MKTTTINIDASVTGKGRPPDRTQLQDENLPTSTSFGLSVPQFTNGEFSDFALILPTSQMPTVSGVSTGDDGGSSVARGGTKIVSRAGPAPVLREVSIRRKRELSRQASIDMVGREHINLSSVNDGRGFQRTASYMAQTESSLRHNSIGSEASISGSIRRLRQRRGAEGDDDASDMASITSSQWSVRRRRVGPHTVQPVERPVPGVSSERAQGIAARTTAAQRVAAASINGGPSLQGNHVVVRGGACLSASRKSSVATSDNVSPHAQPPAYRLNLFASGQASTSLTTITVSDDDTAELTKSGASVSLSPITSGTRSGHKTSRHHIHHGSSGSSKSLMDADAMGDEVDTQDEPVPRSTQPVSFDGPSSGHRNKKGGGASARDKSGRPPLTPRGDASSHAAGGAPRSHNNSLSLSGDAVHIPSTMLTSNTVHRHSNSLEYVPQLHQPGQRRNPTGESFFALRGPNGVPPSSNNSDLNGTAIHRFTEGHPFSSEYDTVGRKSMDSNDADAIDDTPISVLKERANREAEHNARRSSDQPVVPRLELSEITAKRDRQRRSTPYKVAHGGHDGYGPDTPLTGGSMLSNVTVSSMTDLSTPHLQGFGEKGHSHLSGHHPTKSSDAHGSAPLSTSSAQQSKVTHNGEGHVATYDSRGPTPARKESAAKAKADASAPTTTGTFPATTTTNTATAEFSVKERESGGPAGPAATSSTTTQVNSTVNNHSHSSTAPARNGAVTTDEASKPAAKNGNNTTTEKNSVISGVGNTKKQPSSTPNAVAAPTQNGASEPKKRRAFEKSTGTSAATGSRLTAPPPPPPAKANSKEKPTCCAVM